jgi:DNA-binding response OmpR family regulator
MPHILVVDDERSINELIAVTLKQEGYEVSQAPDGKAAVRMAHELKPDLILLDMMMPGMTGIDVARTLHASPGTIHIPIIFVTALSEPRERVEGLAIPQAVDYVCKPFELQELVIRVRNALSYSNAVKCQQAEIDVLQRRQ